MVPDVCWLSTYLLHVLLSSAWTALTLINISYILDNDCKAHVEVYQMNMLSQAYKYVSLSISSISHPLLLLSQHMPKGLLVYIPLC